jgi:hypothetical protein
MMNQTAPDEALPPQDADPKPPRRFRWLRWSNALYILFVAGVALGVFGVVIGEFWTVTIAGYLLAISFAGLALKSLMANLAKPAAFARDGAE